MKPPVKIPSLRAATRMDYGWHIEPPNPPIIPIEATPMEPITQEQFNRFYSQCWYGLPIIGRVTRRHGGREYCESPWVTFIYTAPDMAHAHGLDIDEAYVRRAMYKRRAP